MLDPVYYTADMVLALPDDGNRYETVHGELLVTPAPRLWHQEVVDRLRDALRAYLQQHRVGHLFSAPADISWGADLLVQPDLFVVPLEEARTLEWSQIRTLLLTVEVLSPGTARHDRFTKRRLYQEVGITWRSGHPTQRFLRSSESGLPGSPKEHRKALVSSWPSCSRRFSRSATAPHTRAWGFPALLHPNPGT
jgi:hypothetical protein